MILPAWAAKEKARLIAVSSRLIVPFAAPSSWRRTTYLRISAVVIAEERASPKNGRMCFSNLVSTSLPIAGR